MGEPAFPGLKLGVYSFQFIGDLVELKMGNVYGTPKKQIS